MQISLICAKYALREKRVSREMNFIRILWMSLLLYFHVTSRDDTLFSTFTAYIQRFTFGVVVLALSYNGD